MRKIGVFVLAVTILMLLSVPEPAFGNEGSGFQLYIPLTVSEIAPYQLTVDFEVVNYAAHDSARVRGEIRNKTGHDLNVTGATLTFLDIDGEILHQLEDVYVYPQPIPPYSTGWFQTNTWVDGHAAELNHIDVLLLIE